MQSDYDDYILDRVNRNYENGPDEDGEEQEEPEGDSL